MFRASVPHSYSTLIALTKMLRKLEKGRLFFIHMVCLSPLFGENRFLNSSFWRMCLYEVRKNYKFICKFILLKEYINENKF